MIRASNPTRSAGWLSAADLRSVTPIIRLAYEGVQDRSAWSEMIEQARRLFRGHDASLVRTPLRTSASAVFVTAGIDPALVKLFQSTWGYPPRHAALAEAIRKGADGVLLTEEIMPWQQSERTDYFEVFRKPRGVRWEIGGGSLQDPHLLCYMTVNRTRTQPSFGAREWTLAEAIVPHVAQALQLDARAEVERLSVASLKLTVESLTDAMFAIERDGGLRPLNPAAERFLGVESLAASRPVAMQQPACPLVSVIADVLQFERFLGGDLAGPSQSASLRRNVTFASGRRYRVDGTLRFEKGLIACAVVEIRELPANLAIDEGALRRRWELTPKEITLVHRLIEGPKGSAELCRDLGISHETLHTHLRHLFEKTQTGNRAALLAAVLREARAE